MSKTLVLARVFPPEVGGSGRWMWDLYSRMPAGEFVVAAGGSPGCEAFDAASNLATMRLPLHLESWGAFGLERGTTYYALHQQLSALIKQQQVASIHAACCLPEGFLAWMQRRRHGIPYYVYVHGEELNVIRSSRELTWMARRVLGGAEKIIANSRNTARLLQDGWVSSPNRVHVMHPGVDTEHFRPAPLDPDRREALGWGTRRVVLSVGRLQRRKGHEELIRALPEIRRSVADVLLAVVGDGPERERLGELTRELDLESHVQFHGEMAGALLLSAYQQCDVFALPNLEMAGDIEGFGIVLAEAQACGKPVVAGNSGGTPETLNPSVTGELVDAENLALLASAVRTLLTDAERRERMGAAARSWAVDQFDWRICIAIAQQVFRDANVIAKDSIDQVELELV